MAKNFYLTTTLPYVNAEPHLGFALEIVRADVLARYRQSLGDNVFFNTGTDEHGQKIYEAAAKAGSEVKAYVDHYAGRFQALREGLNLSYDKFVRTTDPAHVAAAQEIWRRCKAKGDIEKRKYVGLYCVGCESYKTERDLQSGRCPLHPDRELSRLDEENWFFLFSKYQKQLLDYLSGPGVIVPEWRRQEAINFVQKGLEDFSISRRKDQLAWGVPVPDDDSQVMYVWFDALTSYISCLGWPTEGKFQEFWERGQTLQLAGKDQLRFQSLIWQAMLMSADIKNTDAAYYHGFINSGGQKMSKSLGNVLDPIKLVDEYGTDAVRYFLLRHVNDFEDSDVTEEKIKEAYNANLANGLGNLVSRVMKMATSNDVVAEAEYLPPKNTHIESLEFNKEMDSIWTLIGGADGQIQITKPFELIKTDREKAVSEIKNLLLELQRIADLLKPLLPNTSEKIHAAIRENKMPEPLFPRKD